MGRDRQPSLTAAARFRVPAYAEHNGWLLLDVEAHVNWDEVDCLFLVSYRHFVLKRRVKALDDGEWSTA